MTRLKLFEELKSVLAQRQPLKLGPAMAGFAVEPASVLMPFYCEGGEPYLLFLKRPDGQYRHAGQIAFPGGRREVGESSLACALREAEEEVGLAPGDVEVLGELDEYDTLVTGFRVTPIVGVIPAPYPFRPDPREVERLIHVPLSRLMDPAAFRAEERFALGRKWPVYYYDAGPDVIWGVTAAMLLPLLEIIRGLGR
ncbi:MAG: CoA pyrophosphatase [Deltaproteobacteria bacterium]|nr:CoA pyrophosphatase [Deltaproteobacteria bacterium]